jgi:Ca2+-binding RTX toxin-like protein
MSIIRGIPGDDFKLGDVNGVPEDDTIFGLAGSDQLSGFGGDDRLFGSGLQRRPLRRQQRP